MSDSVRDDQADHRIGDDGDHRHEDGDDRVGQTELREHRDDGDEKDEGRGKQSVDLAESARLLAHVGHA